VSMNRLFIADILASFLQSFLTESLVLFSLARCPFFCQQNVMSLLTYSSLEAQSDELSLYL